MAMELVAPASGWTALLRDYARRHRPVALALGLTLLVIHSLAGGVAPSAQPLWSHSQITP